MAIVGLYCADMRGFSHIGRRVARGGAYAGLTAWAMAVLVLSMMPAQAAQPAPDFERALIGPAVARIFGQPGAKRGPISGGRVWVVNTRAPCVSAFGNFGVCLVRAGHFPGPRSSPAR